MWIWWWRSCSQCNKTERNWRKNVVFSIIVFKAEGKELKVPSQVPQVVAFSFIWLAVEILDSFHWEYFCQLKCKEVCGLSRVMGTLFMERDSLSQLMLCVNVLHEDIIFCQSWNNFDFIFIDPSWVMGFHTTPLLTITTIVQIILCKWYKKLDSHYIDYINIWFEIFYFFYFTHTVCQWCQLTHQAENSYQYDIITAS